MAAEKRKFIKFFILNVDKTLPNSAKSFIYVDGDTDRKSFIKAWIWGNGIRGTD